MEHIEQVHHWFNGILPDQKVEGVTIAFKSKKDRDYFQKNMVIVAQVTKV